MNRIIFEAYRIGSLELRNRFMRSATWDGTADSSGAATDASVALYKRLGQGEIGLIVTGHAFVSQLGQADRGQYGAHSNDMIPGLSYLAEEVHKGGGKIALQLAHAGLNSVCLPEKGITIPAVSRRPGLDRQHREMTDKDIEALIDDFAEAAVRAREAGFDAVQIHAAHGYLFSQFISPLFNFRDDRWGGSPENRRRFHLEVVRGVRRAIGDDFPLLIKFGVQDDAPGGLTLDEGTEVAQQMEMAGIDAIEISAGIASPTRPAGGVLHTPSKKSKERAFFRERASVARRAVKIPIAVVGGIRSLEMAQDIVDSGDADMISMARPFIREPGLVARWMSGEREPARCISCRECFFIAEAGEPLECQEERRLQGGS
jgi:2,4-dienoyl-CoA reductase-like NADH-dependent reductase (Old Yellow Enzyme family)